MRTILKFYPHFVTFVDFFLICFNWPFEDNWYFNFHPIIFYILNSIFSTIQLSPFMNKKNETNKSYSLYKNIDIIKNLKRTFFDKWKDDMSVCFDVRFPPFRVLGATEMGGQSENNFSLIAKNTSRYKSIYALLVHNRPPQPLATNPNHPLTQLHRNDHRHWSSLSRLRPLIAQT